VGEVVGLVDLRGAFVPGRWILRNVPQRRPSRSVRSALLKYFPSALSQKPTCTAIRVSAARRKSGSSALGGTSVSKNWSKSGRIFLGKYVVSAISG
jgi:hypothetical protein